MKSKGNKLQSAFKEAEKEIKSRGGLISKDDFFNELADHIPDQLIADVVNKYSPFEFLNNEKMKNDSDYRKKIQELYKSSI